MKFFLPFLYLALLVFSPVLALSTAGNSVSKIESIHFLGERNGREIIQFQLDGNISPKVFELPGENPRVVFDFIQTSYPAKERKVIKAGGKFVKRIRVGLHQQPVAKTRVVIDLTTIKDFVIEKKYLPSKKVLEVQVYLKAQNDDIRIYDTKKKTVQDETQQDQVAEYEKIIGKPAADSGKAEHVVKQVEKQAAVVEKQVVATPLHGDTAVVEPTQKTEKIRELQNKPLKTDSLKTSPVAVVEVPVLLNVSYEKTTNNKEMVLFKLSGFHPPVVFAIEEEEPRIVCDFLDARLGADIKNVLDSNGAYIRRVRVARHNNPDKVRVVLDLVAQNNYDLKQVFFKEDNLFVVVISNLGDM